MDDIPAGMIVNINVDLLEETSRRRFGFTIELKFLCRDAAAAAHVTAAFA
jgi:hypothetical protein